MVAMVIALCAVTILWGERIGVNAGMGWDGQQYVSWAGDFPPKVLGVGTTEYHAQRVLPSAVVWGLLKLTGLRSVVPNILAMFKIFDAALLVLAAGFFAHLGMRMRWRRATCWVGFVALFAGFANARHALYYPALTDPSAFALGVVMTWAYLLRHPIALWVCALLGAVTWPALAPLACVLLVLRRLDAPLAEPSERWRWWVRGGSALLAIAATTAFLVLAAHYLKHPVRELGISKFADWVPRSWLPITWPTLAVLLAASWYIVVHQPALWNPIAFARTQRPLYLVLAIAGVVVVWVIRSWWIARVGIRGPGPTGEQFLCLQTLEALRGPLWGLVHHVVYFGPIIAIAAVRWPAVCRAAAGWGHGAMLALVLVVAFAAASESRQWIHLLPLLVAATLTATDELWTMRRALVFAGVALAWSKLWLRIGYDTPGDWRTFPTQRYFMQLGPWASDTMYFVHLAAAVVTAAGLWLLLRHPPGESSASEARTTSSPSPPPP